MRRTICTTFICMALSLGLALADETVTLKDGRKAILKDDGTYKYLDDEKGNQENDYPDINILT